MNDEIYIDQEELSSVEEPAGDPSGKPPSKHHWKRALKWFAIVVGLGVVAAAAFLYFNLSRISVNPFGFGKLKGESSGRVNIMMLGVGDPGHDGQDLSDTNLLLSVDTRNHKIAVISVPRDTKVTIPGHGSGKINTANAKGGVATAKKVFESNLGVPVHYYVRANFSGLKQVVDAVGGVDVENTTTLYDAEYPCDSNQYKSCGFRLKPGKYHLDGTTALKYVRCRKGTCGDDFGRAKRQQEVMQAIRQRATSAGTLANPLALGKLVTAAGDNIDTDLSVNNLMRLNELTKQTPKNDIYNVVFNEEPDGFLIKDRYSEDILPEAGDFDEIKSFVQAIFKRAPIWTEHPMLIVQNGTTTAGLGGKFDTSFESDNPDATVTAVTNAPTLDYPTTQIIDYTAGKKPHTLQMLQKLIGVKTVTPPPVQLITPPADFVIILGADYAAKAGGTATTSTQAQ